ncbi:hypothetical protein AKJ09_04367 [Labilithrix luteola]|uniref:Uncharacterized protein n=1 Tax=Labilithrix luteola TaxID=1391654 RepID=A0A0K1PW11_9BACT|nr:hypothetical protein [Labilithrix luteola]AKU97703.1 hypothetical protein AKJ09_04367 [Labilithrix luteola]
MATDNSPPRIKLIVTIGVITIVTLAGLNLVLNSYYAMMSDEAQTAKRSAPVALEEHQKAEQAALTGAKMPIDQAMAQLAKGNREGLVTPQQSDDLGPMTGWSKLPKHAPEPIVGAAGPEAGDAGAEAADGGAAAADGGALAADGGAAPLATDAGAPAKGGDAGAAPHAPAADAGAHH